MHFHLLNSDGPSQCGTFQIGKYIVETPILFFPHSKCFKEPSFAELILTNTSHPFDGPQLMARTQEFTDSLSSKTRENNGHISSLIFSKNLSPAIYQWIRETLPSKMKYCVLLSGNNQFNGDIDNNTKGIFHIIASAKQLYQNPKEFVNYIIRIRESLNYDSLVYLPSVAHPANIALLVYSGIDALDTIQAILAARKNIMFFPTGNLEVNELKQVPCICPSCSKITDISELNFCKILEHNYYAIYQEMQLVRHAIAHQNLRRLVDIRVGAFPHLVSILRELQNDGAIFLEKRTSLYQHQVLNATTFESTYRPEIMRFQQRVIERYEKPKSASVLLLLPCSMKKPYSFSQSHQKFHTALFSSKNPYSVHEIILTSPIGLVPRELELIYPASRYDIPVTGIWYANEQKLIREILLAYLNKNKYMKILIHLSENMASFLKDIIPNGMYIPFTGSSNSVNAVECLAKTIQRETENLPHVSGKRRWFDNMLSLASYQFTLPLAKSLLKDSVVTGKYPYLKIIDSKGIQLGMTTEKRGFISLTLEGGKRLLSHEKYLVHISDDFVLKGSVFVPGIKNADSSIRRGDEVLIIQKKELQAVGVAIMNGEEMMRRSYGEAIKVRHSVN